MPGPAQEFRPLTVMFCDLVDSTQLFKSMSLEEGVELLSRYRDEVREIVERHGGHIHRHVGDGLLIYFGLPKAYEDTAHRAARAGLEIAARVSALGPEAPQPIRVRISIHAGRVLVSSDGGEVAAFGDTVVFAARLQEHAPHNRVILTKLAMQLVETHFETEVLGHRRVEDFGEQECHLLVCEKRQEAESRYQTKFVGRSIELAWLTREWQSVRPGAPRAVLVSGDAGIGKSRLVQEFRATLSRDDITVLTWRCSPYFSNSALHPVIRGLTNFLELRVHREGVDRLEALESIVPETLSAQDVVPPLAELLSVPYESRYGSLEGSAERRKNAISDAVRKLLAHEAALRPMYLIVEDVTWIDPSTVEFLRSLLERPGHGSILLVMTYRTEGSRSWTSPVAARQLSLGRLSDDSARDIILACARGMNLPDHVVRLLLDRTDGVPLFLEESAAMAVDSLAHAADGERDTASRRSIENRIPTGIQDLLATRLERLGAAKGTAQAAAAIGREFSLDVLRSVVTRVADSELASSDDALAAHLPALIEAGTIVPQDSTDAGAHYAFKHGLVRDAAYQTLVRGRRLELHARIAAALSEVSGAAPEPELLAYHYTAAEAWPRAIECWFEAGRHAKRRSAHSEAISHFEKTLELIAQPNVDAEAHASLELHAQVSLAACYAAVGGYSSNDAGQAYAKAKELADAQGDENIALRARFGVEAYFFMRGDFERAHQIAESSRETALALQKNAGTRPKSDNNWRLMMLAQAWWVRGNVRFHQGRFDEAMSDMNRCVELCAPVPIAAHGLMQDPVVMCHAYQAWYVWELGYPDTALAVSGAGVELARESGHPFSIGVALAFHACIQLFRREYEEAVTVASQSIEVCEEPGFRTWLAWAKVLRGRGLSEAAATRGLGISEIKAGLRLWDASGAVVTRPFALACLAEAYFRAGSAERALAHIREADGMRFGERYFEAEIARCYGVFLRSTDARTLRADGRTLEDPEGLFHEAIHFAAERGMASTMLRASIELAKLRFEKGNVIDGARVLQRALARFDADDPRLAELGTVVAALGADSSMRRDALERASPDMRTARELLAARGFRASAGAEPRAGCTVGE